MANPDVEDALVLAARYDLQQLTVGERAAINSVDRVARAMTRLTATGQASPFREIGSDLLQANAAFRQGALDLEGLNIALQRGVLDMRAMREQGIEPDARALLALTNILDRTTMALGRLNAARAGRGGGGRPPVDIDPGSRVAKGADSAAAGIARVRSGLAQLAVMSINTTSPIGQVAQGLAFMAGASSGVVIGLAGVVLAYEKLTEGSRKAKEELDKFVEAQVKAARLRADPNAEVIPGIENSRKEIERLQTQLEKLRQGSTRRLSPRPGDVETFIDTKKIAETQKRIDDLRIAVGGANVAMAESGTTLIRNLALQEASFGKTGLEAQRLSVAMDSSLNPAIRAGALRILDHLIALEREKQALLDAARAARELAAFNERLEETARNAAGEARIAANAWFDDYAKALKKASDATEDFAKNTREAVNSLPTPEEIHLDFINKTRDAFREITDAEAGVVQTANQVGLLSDGLAQAALDALSVADAIKEITLTGAGLTNILGLVGAGLGLLGTIGGAVFGKDKTQTEADNIRAQNENTIATQRNTAAVERARGAGGVAETQALLAKIPDDIRTSIASFAHGGLIGGPEAATRLLDQQLKAAGSSLEELAAIAKANGIDILNEKGLLVAGALDQLDEKLRLAGEAALRFRDDLGSRARQEADKDRLGIGGRSADTDTAALERARDLQLEALHLSDEQEAAIRALDLTSKAGRAAFLKFEQDLAKRALTPGGLSKEELGDFPDVDALLDNAADAADAIKQLEGAANDATKSMTNIPDTFKLAAAEWQARAQDIIPKGPVAPPLRGTDLLPESGTTAAAGPTTSVTGNTINIVLPSLPKNASIEDIGRAVADELEARAIASFGLAPPP